MTDDFYRALEDRYRGSRELIKSRLRVYLPFVEPLKALYADATAIDLGCGRGEWLELMGEAGFSAQGVDLDDGMLAACVERGLSAERGDAIEYLKSLRMESVAVLSAFHFVEHVPFDALQTLVQEALRVLVPAGLLILETPNPENLKVGACNFYLDPTHQRPIPPLLLSFLPEYHGFARTKVLRLQEAPGLPETSAVSLSEVLLGVSPDYSVVAQKGSEDSQAVARFDAAFGQSYGVNLDLLAMNYDRSIGDRLDEILARVERSTELSARQAQEMVQQSEARAQQAEGREAKARAQLQEALEVARQAQEKAEQAEARVRQAQGEMETVRQELHNVHQANHHHWQLAEERGQHVQALLSSTSWRVTAPIRWAATSLRLLGRMPSRVVVRLRIWLKPRVVRVVTSPAPQRMIERTGRWVMARGRLADPIRVFLRRHGRLRNRLRWLILGLPPPGVVIAAQEECVELAARKPRLPAILGTKGVNARQRTPLESNFLAYAAREEPPSPRAGPNIDAILSPLEANFLGYAGREQTPSSRAAPNIHAILLRIREELERNSRK
jgi:O-antigen chain-terminating methyltransferase